MRTLEFALISAPLVAILLWWLGLRVFSWRAVSAAAVLLAAIGLTLFLLGTDRGFTGAYDPAKLHGTVITPGRGD
jgi:hypothetical protein